MQKLEFPALPPAPPKLPALPPSRKLPLRRLTTAARLDATVSLLSRNHLFQRCTRDELYFLAATSHPVVFEAGDRLCVEGGYAMECYVVAEGHAVVKIGSRGVATVAADEVVGERAIVLDTSRAATVVATEHTVTCAIARERLQSLLRENYLVRRWMTDDVRRHYPPLR